MGGRRRRKESGVSGIIERRKRMEVMKRRNIVVALQHAVAIWNYQNTNTNYPHM
jgi:hypothetical protein